MRKKKVEKPATVREILEKLGISCFINPDVVKKCPIDKAVDAALKSISEALPSGVEIANEIMVFKATQGNNIIELSRAIRKMIEERVK